jgi:hypothetical protein
MNLPIAALRRLDAMAVEARLARASRNELLAALIATAPVDAAGLEKPSKRLPSSPNQRCAS